jgi:hypothetical protein
MHTGRDRGDPSGEVKTVARTLKQEKREPIGHAEVDQPTPDPEPPAHLTSTRGTIRASIRGDLRDGGADRGGGRSHHRARGVTVA